MKISYLVETKDLQKRYVVPRDGVEPSWALSPLDFESSAYTNFATPAYEFMIIRCAMDIGQGLRVLSFRGSKVSSVAS